MALENYFTASDGTKLFYYKLGQGPVLIFLHGNSESSWIFRKQIRFLKANYTCLALDTRAHGRSHFRGKRIKFEQLAQDLLEIMNAENIAVANLLGFSDGANTAMLFASQYPERVNKLILNAGNLTQLGFIRPVGLLIKLIGKVAYKSPVLRLLSEETGLKFDDLKNIKADTLVLNGQFDVVKSHHAREIAASIPHSHFQILSFGTHLTFYFRPGRFNTIVNNFLKNKT
ncbi:alpha/beta fold hydrolase [Lactococcus nasutitermitis]|uniref:Alpha/beta fold hydrolase n=1 Tax=Lactococcus nasutitermitis TaxID=1652957 RepID=A0ABV9JFH1_9LACT|nr:alpha/beta hydrolase [Lactococcus nasutitermitis]